MLYESINFAALKKLPIIFACENNLYSTHMPIKECRLKNNIFEIGISYGIISFRVDGNDVLRVYEAAKKAVEICRKNQGPVFIEFMTYRLRGHVGANDSIQGTHTDIRPKEEIAKWRKKDPIRKFEQYLIRNKILAKGNRETIRKETEAEVNDAYVFAKKSSYPKKSELTKYVFKK